MSMEDWKLVSVGKVARTIRELCEEKDLPFTPTCGYYELSKKENISKDKLLVAVEEEEGVVVQGKENVRKKLKLETGNIRIGPGDLPEGWSLYIQSTSHNRKLTPGTTSMIFLGSASRAATSMADTEDVDNDPWKIVSVGKKKLTVSELCEAKGLPYTPACGFYELTKKETVSDTKTLVASHESEGTIIHGSERVRKELGLESGRITISKGDFDEEWTLYIQNTAANRALQPGTTAIIYVGRKKSLLEPEGESSESESEEKVKKPTKKMSTKKKNIQEKRRKTSSESESESESESSESEKPKQKKKAPPKKAEKRQKKDPMDSWKLVSVGKKKLSVSDLCNVKGLDFMPGCGYYELSRRENISAGKKLVACHEEDGTVIQGTDSVREELGLGDGMISVKPSDLPEHWSLYIQSTSANRGLLPGTTAMIFVGNNSAADDSESE